MLVKFHIWQSITLDVKQKPWENGDLEAADLSYDSRMLVAFVVFVTGSAVAVAVYVMEWIVKFLSFFEIKCLCKFRRR